MKAAIAKAHRIRRFNMSLIPAHVWCRGGFMGHVGTHVSMLLYICGSGGHSHVTIRGCGGGHTAASLPSPRSSGLYFGSNCLLVARYYIFFS